MKDFFTKEKRKILLILVIILICVTCLIIFLFISNNSKEKKNIQPTETENTLQTVATKEKIKIEYAGLTKSGDFVIKITNDNNVPVCLSSITTDYKDKDGKSVRNVNSFDSFVCVPANSFTYAFNIGFEENFSDYPKYEFDCELSNISDYFVYNGIDITSKDTGDQIEVELNNNSGSNIEEICVTVVYYKNNKIVGIKPGYEDETIANNEKTNIEIEYPNDEEYKEISFDKYEVYYTHASIEN